MANAAGISKSLRTDLLTGQHNFGVGVVRASTAADTFKASLRLVTDTVDTTTTAYSSTGELAGTGGYTAGGLTVTNATAPANSGGTGIVAFWTPSAAFSWTSFTSSGTFDALLLYNSTNAGKPVAVFTFGSQFVTSGTFTLNMPTNDLSTGLLRIA